MKITDSRAIYIPTGALKVAPKGGGVVFFTYTTRQGEEAAVCFIGRAQKPSWNYRFVKPGDRERRIRNTIEAVRARAERRAADRAERNKPHTLEVGLILYTCWGYDQTNTEYYLVVNVPSACYVTLQRVGAPLARGEEGFMTGKAVPDPENRIGKPIRRKVDMGGTRPSVRINESVTAWVWDGKERRVSWYA